MLVQGRTRYRIGQFLHGWRAGVSAQDYARVRQVLGPATALFLRMPLDAQAHSLRVLRTLEAEGEVSPDLAAAALLHDVGKVAATDAGAYLGLWLRGPLVVLEALWPSLLVRLASPEPSASLRYAIYVQAEHPQIGAAWARAEGCTELTCRLIAHHQDSDVAENSPATQTLARLQRADGRN
jgi:hypothetical protein